MNIEYAKLGLAAIAMIVVCVVSVLRPESAQTVERIASNVVSGALGAVGGSSIASVLAQSTDKKKEEKD